MTGCATGNTHKCTPAGICHRGSTYDGTTKSKQVIDPSTSNYYDANQMQYKCKDALMAQLLSTAGLCSTSHECPSTRPNRSVMSLAADANDLLQLHHQPCPAAYITQKQQQRWLLAAAKGGMGLLQRPLLLLPSAAPHVHPAHTLKLTNTHHASA